MGLSMLIASMASYVALDLAGRVTVASGTARRYWILASAAAMGIGIWSMHFVGMLALVMDMPVAYDVPLLGASIVIAVAGSAVTFFMSARERLRGSELAVASLFMGPAIAGMHYTGMAAMRMPARISYDPALVTLSAAIAISFSFIALQLAMRLRNDESGRGRLLRVGAAAMMGAAVYGMHYTGMLAASFDPTRAEMMASRWSVLGNDTLAAAVAVTTFMILAIAAGGAIADRRLRARIAEADELRRTSDLLHAVIDDSPEAIIVTDPDLRVTRWSSAAAGLFGWNAEEMIGRSLAAILPEDGQHDRAMTPAEPPPPDGQRTRTEATYRRKDGSGVEVSASRAVLRDSRNQPAGFVFLVRDETDRKRLEAQIRQSQKMEAVGQLAGGIAHDFNNLLTAITSYAALALSELGPGHNARNDVREIQKAAERAASLTKQLLAFSRQQRIQPEPLRLNAVIDEMREMLRRLIPANIDLIVLLGEDVGSIKADKGQMEQVLLNVALNARDSMPDAGTLTIGTDLVDLTDADEPVREFDVAPGRYARLSVCDTGTGMTPEVEARMFEPFFTTKPPGSGTGLGLATVYGIVRQAGGCISVSSSKEKGTTVWVMFPRLVEVTPPAGKNGKASVPRGSETILLVEDEQTVRSVARRILERDGYTVIEAATGQEALFRHGGDGPKIDLVVSDMVMPGMSGYELEARLRQRDPSLRILFISGYSREALARGVGVRAGEEFLQKPFTPETLVAKVREVLDA